MAISMTQAKAFDAHKVPAPTSPIWFTDPPRDVEDPGDKKAPTRIRAVKGDYYVLVEQVSFLAFPSPDEKAKAKAKGQAKPPPRWVEQCYIHLLHSQYLTVRTFKVYRHGSKSIDVGGGKVMKFPRYFYSDSLDYEVASASKSAPPKDRETMISTLARLWKLSEDEVSGFVSEVTFGH